MKVLITKSDGTPTKSKVYAIKYLQEKGIDESCLIEEKGQFFYEEVEEVTPHPIPLPQGARGLSYVSWDTNVFDKNNEKTKLVIPNTDITATINGKHPAGQLKDFNCFEICIGTENFLMSLELVSKIFRVKEV